MADLLSGFFNSNLGGQLLGGGVNLLGSILSNSTTRKAGNTSAGMAQFNPWGTSNLFGTTSYGNGQINQQLSPWAQQLAQSLQGVGTAGAAGAQGYFNSGDLLRQLGVTGMPGYYQAAQDFQLPQGQYDSSMAGMQNSVNGLQNLFAQAQSNPYALEQLAKARSLMGNSYADTEARRLQLLREGAAPYEQQARDSLFSKLYAMGGLGGVNTGGSRDIQAFARGQSEADTSRQLDAMTFAENLYGRDQELGANMFNSGVQNYNSGLDLASRIGSTSFDANNAMLNAALNYNNTGYNRAQQRMANAEALFGFGNQTSQTGASDISSITDAVKGLTDEQKAQAEMGLNFGQAGAAAGANAGKFNYDSAGNPVGSFLSSMGSQILKNGGSITGMLGGLGGAASAAGQVLGAGGGLAGAAGTLLSGGAISPSAALAMSLAPTTAATGAAGAAGATAAASGATASGGMLSGLMAAAPWVAGALAVGAVVANNMPKSSPLNNFNADAGGWTKAENWGGEKYQPDELNYMFGPALKKFAETGGNMDATLAAISPPRTEHEKKMLDRGILHLFSGTGNPLRQLADKLGLGEGAWTASSPAKKDLLNKLGIKL